MTPTPRSAAEIFARAYHDFTLLVAADPRLLGFAGWPYARPVARPANSVPATAIVSAWDNGFNDTTAAAHQAVRALADVVDWQQTYSEAEVGRDFLNRYGWFELIGPSGHFHSDQIRAYVAYWGEKLFYPWHLHEAEELYFILAGHALFEAEGLPPQALGPGDIRIHGSNQPHAMTTTDSPVLALVLWRGAGIEGVPRMGTA